MVYDTINIIYTVQCKYMIKHHKLSTLKFIHPLFYSLVSWLGSTSFQQLKCSSDHKQMVIRQASAQLFPEESSFISHWAVVHTQRN